MAKIKVRGAGFDQKVVLWERDPRHPDGEAFISNDNIMREVEETNEVKTLLARGLLTKDAPKKDAEVSVDAEPVEPTENNGTGATANLEPNQDSEKRRKTPPQ